MESLVGAAADKEWRKNGDGWPTDKEMAKSYTVVTD
jgi:hypothetical protein